MKICSMFGHRDCFCMSEIIKSLKRAVVYAIEKLKIEKFYLGGMGNFDAICLDTLNDNFDKEYINNNYDGTIYPNLELVPHRLAILKRNEWIIEQSDFVIFYINHNWGGANTARKYCEKKHKKYINLGSLRH